MACRFGSYSMEVFLDSESFLGAVFSPVLKISKLSVLLQHLYLGTAILSFILHLMLVSVLNFFCSFCLRNRA